MVRVCKHSSSYYRSKHVDIYYGYCLGDQMKEIKLTRGKVAIVDDEDFDLVSKYRWNCSSKGYALTKVLIDGKRVPYLMHRLILNLPKEEIDHINNDKLDNRKLNLRKCTRTQNCRNASIYKNNTSGFKGVSFRKRTGKFEVQICINKKATYLGSFKTAEEASEAYNKAANLHFGEFANINKKKIKIVCISDTHSKHDYIRVPEGDILIHAGDATMVGRRKELEDFVRWYADRPHKHKIWIAGNHCFGMETNQAAYDFWALRRGRKEGFDVNETRTYILNLCKELGVIYLANTSYEIEGIKFYGSPDQPDFCSWAFNRTNKELTESWKNIPDDTNVLITHAPAYGILDTLLDGELVGDVPLLKRINTLPNLKLHVCGHIHCDAGVKKVGTVTHINASMLDDYYNFNVNNPPRIFEYEV